MKLAGWYLVILLAAAAVAAAVLPVVAIPVGWYGHAAIIEREGAFAGGWGTAAVCAVPVVYIWRQMTRRTILSPEGLAGLWIPRSIDECHTWLQHLRGCRCRAAH
jgi:hypothetical protein